MDGDTLVAFFGAASIVSIIVAVWSFFKRRPVKGGALLLIAFAFSALAYQFQPPTLALCRDFAALVNAPEHPDLEPYPTHLAGDALIEYGVARRAEAQAFEQAAAEQVAERHSVTVDEVWEAFGQRYDFVKERCQ